MFAGRPQVADPHKSAGHHHIAASQMAARTTGPQIGPKVGRRVFLVVVDETEELHAALRFACRRARNTGGRVALLSVTQMPEFQHWMFVGNIMQEETRLQAEERLQSCAADVHALTGEMPELILREGNPRKELLDLVAEDTAISVVVLASGTQSKGPGPLVEDLTGKYAGKLRVPITIVPGDLPPDKIDALT